jgi:hypothetical protein
VTSNERNSWILEIDSALSKWSQGDCTIGDDHWFITRFDPQRPLTAVSEDVVAAEADADLAESAVRGFVVVTQTCDLVRSCQDRSFVEISPLVEVDVQQLAEIRRLKRPSYAYIAGVAEHNLVADLDRVMTVEKAVVATWERIRGCRSDADIRSLGEALARKRSRFAFPDDFNNLVHKLQKRMQDKHEKATPEGDALKALNEIRVRAAPSWGDEKKVELFFWFICTEEDDRSKDMEWHKRLPEWLNLLPTSGRFISVDGLVVSLEDMTAKDYVQSDRLDLDRLSSH